MIYCSRSRRFLKAPVDVIKNFIEEAAVNYFNTFNDNSGSGSCSNSSTFNFHAPEDCQAIVKKNAELYERLLAAEKGKNALLEKLILQKSLLISTTDFGGLIYHYHQIFSKNTFPLFEIIIQHF